MTKFDKLISWSIENASRLSMIVIALILGGFQWPLEGRAAGAEESFIHSYALQIMEYSNMGTRFSSREPKGFVGTFSTIEKCEKLRNYMMNSSPSMFDRNKRFYQILTCEPSTLPAAQ